MEVTGGIFWEKDFFFLKASDPVLQTVATLSMTCDGQY